ncbi:MFS transporter [Chitinophaga rhizosphaerae]|uniref:MFS transporter n=1 Tax=Chitinophaga rhizosphaerae TaxID=1864947 RepID=UPI000F80B779|nr:MFS transporter [Chitinophaga rhizosphaerae]
MKRQTSDGLRLAIISSAVFLAVIDIFIVNVALPSIRTGLNGSDADMQLVIAMYLLGYASFLILGGRLGDRFGKKRIFVWSMLLFTIASCFCGVAGTPLQLNFSRFVQGVGAALLVPQSIALVHVLYPGHHERIRALGIYGTIAGAASVIGQFLGGIIPDLDTAVAGWRLIFLINLPVGSLAAVLAWRKLPETPLAPRARFDVAGVGLLTAGLMCLVFPLIQGRELGWPLWCFGVLGASAPILAAFIWLQRRKSEPLMQLRLFAIPDFRIALCATLCYFMVQDSYFLIHSVLLQTGLGLGATATGLLFVAQGIGYVLASMIAMRLLGKYGKKVLLAGVLLMIVMLLMHMYLFAGERPGITALLPVLFLYGMGCGTVLPSMLTMAMKRIPAELSGAASGTYSTIQQIAVALGVSICGGVFFSLVQAGHSHTQAYLPAMGLDILLLLLTGCCVYLLPEGESQHVDCWH